MPSGKNAQKTLWKKTSLNHCVIDGNSGIFYVRKRIHGKLISRSLKTKKISVARAKLRDTLKDLEGEFQLISDPALAKSSIKTVGDAVKVYTEDIQSNPDHKPSYKKDLLRNIKKLTKTWPHLETLQVKKVTPHHCNDWLRKFKNYGTGFVPQGSKKQAKPPSWSSTKKAIDALRAVFEAAVAHHAIRANPAKNLNPGKEPKQTLELPTREQFLEMVKLIRAGGPNKKNTKGPDSADLIEGLAYSGMRLGEANALTFADCVINGDKSSIRIDKQLQEGKIITPKSNESIRTIPMIASFKRLLEDIRNVRPEAGLDDRVFVTKNAIRSLEAACRHLNLPRIGHHDLRDLFATTCIENNIDVPTVAKWLGHGDGGKTLIERYWHLSDKHSQDMAKKVQF